MKKQSFARRRLLTGALAFAAGVAVFSAQPAAAAAAEEGDKTRPNIVFAFADDWGRYASAYADYEGPNSLNALIESPPRFELEPYAGI